MPFIIASLIEGHTEEPIYVTGGYGCHFDKNIAMMRAATEAIQSRLTIIHGGRDDLTKAQKQLEQFSFHQKTQLYKDLKKYLTDIAETINYENISDYGWNYDNLEDYITALLGLLKKNGFNYVLRVAYSKPEEPLQIVKIIIPKMELFSNETRKIGIRLRNFAAKIAKQTNER